MVAVTYHAPTRIGSLDNQDIELYPHGTGKVNVRNIGINIPSGKTYDVDGARIRTQGLFHRQNKPHM